MVLVHVPLSPWCHRLLRLEMSGMSLRSLCVRTRHAWILLSLLGMLDGGESINGWIEGRLVMCGRGNEPLRITGHTRLQLRRRLLLV